MKKMLLTMMFGLGLLTYASNADAVRIMLNAPTEEIYIEMNPKGKTILDLKKEIEKQKGYPVNAQGVIRQGRAVDNEILLNTIPTQDLNKLFLIFRETDSDKLRARLKEIGAEIAKLQEEERRLEAELAKMN